MQRTHPGLIGSLVLAALVASACTPIPTTGATAKPAVVETIEASDLKRVVLTEKAAERLDIQTALVREEMVTRTRTVGGEVIPVTGGEAANARGLRVHVRLNRSDLENVDRAQSARIQLLEADEDDDDFEAEPDDATEAEDAEDADSDVGEGSLYYSLADSDHGLAAGQRVWVELTLAGGGSSRKVIPYAAVIYDVEGGTWVYTNPEPLVFIRHRISIDYIEDEEAILTDGPPAGTRVVTVGGAELYGAETGVSK